MFEMRAKMITVGLLAAAVMLPTDLAKADQLGHASWYSTANTTANGERMNPNELIAAHLCCRSAQGCWSESRTAGPSSCRSTTAVPIARANYRSVEGSSQQHRHAQFWNCQGQVTTGPAAMRWPRSASHRQS
jgi:hypothetical protein